MHLLGSIKQVALVTMLHSCHIWDEITEEAVQSMGKPDWLVCINQEAFIVTERDRFTEIIHTDS